MSDNLPKKETFPISEAARFLGVSPQTLRRWDRKEILKPYRTKGNQRRYLQADLKAFRAGKKAFKTPFLITRAAEYLGVHPQTLRRWEREGVITPQRTNGNQRRYTREELDQVKVTPEAPLPATQVKLAGVAGVAPPPPEPVPSKAEEPPSLPPRIRVRTLEEYRPSPFARFYPLKRLAVITLALVVASSAWTAVPPLGKARIARFFAPSPLNPIVDVNDIFEYEIAEEQVFSLRAKFPLEVEQLVTDTLRVFKDGVFNTTQLLGTIFFGEGKRYFINRLGDATLRAATFFERVAIKTGITAGTALKISFEKATQTGDLTGVEVDFSKITDPPSTLTRYGVHVKDSPEPIATDYGVYVEGTNWDYGIYSKDDVYIDGTLEVGDETTISGNLLPGIDSTFDIGAINLEWANLYVDDITAGTIISGDTTLSSLTVTDQTDLQGDVLDTTGNLTLNDTVDISGALNVTNSTTLSDTLTVAGATILSSTLDVVGATTLSSTLDVSGNTTVGGDLSVTGSVSGGAADFSSLIVTGTSDLRGDVLDTTGNLTLNDSVDVSGDLTVSGGDIDGPLSSITMADEGWVGISSSDERVIFDNAGDISFMGANVGIGALDPSFTLDVLGDIRIRSANNLYFGGTGAADNDVNLYRSAANTLKTDDLFIAAGVNPTLADTDSLGSASAEWRNLYLGDVGRLYFGLDQGIQLWRGTSAPFSGSLMMNHELVQIADWTLAHFLIAYEDASDPPYLQFEKARGTEASPAVVQINDGLGTIGFYGYSATFGDFVQAAAITVVVDAEPGSGYDMPGRIEFRTTPDGSGATLERLRIDNAGKVWFDPSAALDTNLYRSAANTLKTDDGLIAASLTVSQDGDVVPATTTGTSDLGSSGTRWDNVYAVAGNFSGTVTGGDFSCTNCLDFAEFEDTLDLDAALTLNQGTNTWIQNFTDTTTTGFSYVANSLTSGKALDISSSATAFTGNLIDATLSGSNAANTGSLLSLTNSGTSNTNTAFYIKHYATGTNNLAMRVDDVSGDTTPFVIDGAGNVGIGTASPNYPLQVNTDSSNIAIFGYNTQASTNNYGIYGQAGAGGTNNYGVYGFAGGATNDYAIYASVSDAVNDFAIYSEQGKNYFGGNVGIGGNPSSTRLAIYGDGTNPELTLVHGAPNLYATIQGPADRSLYVDLRDNDAGDAFHIRHDASNEGGPADTTAFIVRGDGNVGIGTTGPASDLQIGDGDNSIFFSPSPAANTNPIIAARTTNIDSEYLGFAVRANADPDALSDGAAADVRMVITKLGNVGIGTTGPIEAFSVKGGQTQLASADTQGRVYKTQPITWTPDSGVAHKICEFNPATGAGAGGHIGFFHGVLYIQLVTMDNVNHNPMYVLQRYRLRVKKWYGGGYAMTLSTALLDGGSTGNASIVLSTSDAGDSRIDLDVTFTGSTEFTNNRIASAWIEGVSTATHANNLVIPTIQSSPMFYSWNGQEYIRETRFFTNFDNEEREGVQYEELNSLNLDGAVKGKIVGEEGEITYIDQIAVVVNDLKDGQTRTTVLKPKNLELILHSDDQYVELQSREEIEIEFEQAPPLENGWERKATLKVEGYYEYEIPLAEELLAEGETEESVEMEAEIGKLTAETIQADKIDVQELTIGEQSSEEHTLSEINKDTDTGEDSNSEILVDTEGDLAQVNPPSSETSERQAQTEKILAEEVEANTGIFQRLTVMIEAIFEKITAKTAQIAEAFIQTLRVGKLTADSAEVKEFSVTETSGRAVVAAGESNEFVENTYVKKDSKVFVTFKDPYRPATQYWVSELKEGEGFTVSLDQVVEAEASFDYWIVN